MVKRIAWKATRPVLARFVKNPYKEGSMSSLCWKQKWGKPLTQEQEESIGKIQALGSNLLERFLVFEQSCHRAEEARAHVIAELIDNLPEPMLEGFLARPFSDIVNETGMLQIASYRRENTAVRLTAWALIMSALSVLVSVILLAIIII